MFDHMTAGTGFPHRRGWGTLGAAAVGHLALLVALTSASYLIVETIVPPDTPIVFTLPVAPPVAPAPRPAPAEPEHRATQPSSASARPEGAPLPMAAAPTVPPAPPTDVYRSMVELDPNEGEASDATGADETGSRFGSPDGDGGKYVGVDGPGNGSGTDDGPMPLLPGVEPPVLLEKVVPDYPERARRARLSGRVFVKAVVSPRGDVVDVEIISSTLPIFEESALAAVKEWKYRPATLRGHPVAVHFTVIVSFTLR